VTADEPRWSASSDSRDDGPESDWRKVASVLKETLPPHAPWLDRQRAISAYWFCISATFANQSAVDRLKGEIERDFEAISKLHPRLDHLARIVVRVRGGQHFASVLARRPTLRYRWFGGLPAGLTAIDAYASVTARTFRKFLDTASLPYFSFAEFARENGIPAGGLHPDPDLLLAELIEGSRPALIVGGPGGIGKTRLALEIARAAERQGMLALSCGQRADDRAVEELARSHMKAADVLLFVDYAEAQNQLAAIAAAIEAANAAGHRLPLVATCRASAVSTVQQTLEDLGVRRLMLAGAESGPHAGAYLDWVVRRILAHGGIETIAGLAAVCAGLPVLAAFALHLHEERPETFARLFQGLAGDTSFEQWAGRRIALTLDRLAAGPSSGAERRKSPPCCPCRCRKLSACASRTTPPRRSSTPSLPTAGSTTMRAHFSPPTTSSPMRSSRRMCSRPASSRSRAPARCCGRRMLPARSGARWRHSTGSLAMPGSASSTARR